MHVAQRKKSKRQGGLGSHPTEIRLGSASTPVAPTAMAAGAMLMAVGAATAPACQCRASGPAAVTGKQECNAIKHGQHQQACACGGCPHPRLPSARGTG